MSAADHPRRDDVAIIGFSGRFPGARNVDELWGNLLDGVESRTEFTDEDLAAEGVSVKIANPRHVRAGFVLDDVDKFDAGFFGINPREADTIDPQHRLFLECSWEALENAGYDAERFPGVIGLFGGSTYNNYLVSNLFRNVKVLKSLGPRQLVYGSVPDYMVTRAAYKLNLKGPACFVQSACSTSLVAVHLGCQSLHERESDMVLAGGVSVMVPQRVGYVCEEGGMQSPDGRVHAFDASARGTVFGSGVAIVVLRRLSDALRDGDQIHAVIRGTATNNDGSLKVGFTAPSVEGQAEVVTHALAAAELEPDDITYVEAHGTGTELGDPIELRALVRAFSAGTTRRHYCAVGSIKPNIGHLDAAAGVSSLIKAVMALEHRQLPPSINFETLNPKIELEKTPFFINATRRPWTTPDGAPRRAGVSSFGFGGTNAHVILEEAPPVDPGDPPRSHQVLVLSAKTETALDEQSRHLSDALARHPETSLADVAYTLQMGRRQFAYRRAVVCEDHDAAVRALGGGDARWVSTGRTENKPRRVVFLFPGQGSQYVNMGRGLYDAEPVFRHVVDQCATGLQRYLGFDLRDTLYPDHEPTEADSERLTRTVVTQSAIFAVELALARLWMSWGVTPTAMAGHSIGEYVAACLAGVLDLDDAVKLVARRGELMEGMPEGSMIAVPLPEAKVLPLVEEDDELWLAAVNSPTLSVVSGTAEAIVRLDARLTEIGTPGRRLHTSHAFHSGLMDGAVDPFVETVRSVSLRPPTIPYLSNVTGARVTAELVTDPAYWGRHIRAAVRFSDNLTVLSQDEDTTFLEVGPGNALSTFVRQQSSSGPRVALSSLRHPQEDVSDAAFLLSTLGKLWVAGGPVDWPGYWQGERRRRVPLPTYPFARNRHWVDPDRPNLTRLRRAQAMVEQDDLGDWFFVPSWKRSVVTPASGQDEHAPDRWLVFLDETGVGDALVDRLERRGDDVYTVRSGGAYASDGRAFTVDPSSRSDYVSVVKALRDESRRPTAIVHLWGVTVSPDDSSPDWRDVAQDANTLGFKSVLSLAQALGELGISSKLRLEVVTRGLQEVTGGERLTPAMATVLGPCRVIPLEFPNVVSRAIDLEHDGTSNDVVAERLFDELLSPPGDASVALRRGHRWLQTYEPVHLERPRDRRSVKLREGGTYLITGGLGGIGLVLAQYLAREWHASLVLTSRRGLPPRPQWAAYLSGHAAEDSTSRQILAVQALEEAGAKVLVGAADVADESAMREVVTDAAARFGRIDGVVHAAGVAGGGMIQLKEDEVAAAVLRPKVDGAYVLSDVFRETPLDFILLCSSLTSILGGVGQVDYCAANAFLDAFARWHSVTSGTPTLSVNWTAWKEVGMAVETDMPEGLKSSMRSAMLSVGVTNREGAEAFERMVSFTGDSQIAVSPLDVQLMLEHVREGRVQEDERDAGATEESESSGSDASHARPDLSNAYVEPRTDAERRICAVWRDMLGVRQIGVDDNFFDLGGHSLLAVQVMTRVNEVLGTEIPVAKLYEGLTPGFLAALAEPKTDADDQGKDQGEARERRRAKARRQKEHRQRRLATLRR